MTFNDNFGTRLRQNKCLTRGLLQETYYKRAITRGLLLIVCNSLALLYKEPIRLVTTFITKHFRISMRMLMGQYIAIREQIPGDV